MNGFSEVNTHDGTVFVEGDMNINGNLTVSGTINGGGGGGGGVQNPMIEDLNAGNNKITNFTDIKSKYDIGRSSLIPGESSTYTMAVSFIGESANLDNALNTFTPVPNIVYKKPTVVSRSGANLVKYQMYRGNIVLWVLIQKMIINGYNSFFNSLLDPMYLSSNNISNTSSPDIFTELYFMLKQNVKTQYVDIDGSINYYRYKQTREYPLQTIDTTTNIANDFNDSICTKTINYCRELMIFFNMLLSRYKKLSFLLDTLNKTSLNSSSSYYDFSQSITKAYMNDALLASAILILSV
jgi:hypothetical protein